MGIKLDLTVAETNAVLGLLAEQPYSKVFNLINKIQQQGSPQVEAVAAEEKAAAEAAQKAAEAAQGE